MKLRNHIENRHRLAARAAQNGEAMPTIFFLGSVGRALYRDLTYLSGSRTRRRLIRPKNTRRSPLHRHLTTSLSP